MNEKPSPNIRPLTLLAACGFGIACYAALGLGIGAGLRGCQSDSSGAPVPEHGPAASVVAPAEGGSSPHRDQPAEASDDPLRRFFRVLSDVESGGDDQAVGDGGRSLGRYQIGRLYWQDAGSPGVYNDVTDPAFAESVMLAYWRRWCPSALAALDYETLARVHNGGPRGSSKQSTLPYWRKVQERLQKETSP